ncbi:MAG: nuclear transport factor 2 family protein [Rhodoferax sp.]
MPKARLQAATVGGSADDIEAAFYEALAAADIDGLMACWADEDDIVCIHPGGPRLIGSAAIRASFDAIFANGSMRARPHHVRSVETLASVVHSLVERIEVMTPEGPGEAHVIATNVYQRFAQGWRLVAHHASPGTAHEMLEESPTPQVLH